jgi:hypothetical protein
MQIRLLLKANPIIIIIRYALLFVTSFIIYVAESPSVKKFHVNKDDVGVVVTEKLFVAVPPIPPLNPYVPDILAVNEFVTVAILNPRLPVVVIVALRLFIVTNVPALTYPDTFV